MATEAAAGTPATASNIANDVERLSLELVESLSALMQQLTGEGDGIMSDRAAKVPAQIGLTPTLTRASNTLREACNQVSRIRELL